jgi:alpha-glucosidase
MLPEFVRDYSGHTIDGNKIHFQCQDVVVLVEWCTQEIVKVSLFPDGDVQPDTSFVVIHETWPQVCFTVEDTGDSIWIKSSRIHIGCQKRPFRLSFYNSSGKLILKERSAGGLGWADNQCYAYFNQTDDEHFYGFGERAIELDKKGCNFSSYNTAVFGYSGQLETMNINIPFFCSTKGYGLYFDNTYPGYFDMGSTDPDVYWYQADGGRMIYYFIWRLFLSN